MATVRGCEASITESPLVTTLKSITYNVCKKPWSRGGQSWLCADVRLLALSFTLLCCAPSALSRQTPTSAPSAQTDLLGTLATAASTGGQLPNPQLAGRISG